MLTWYRNSSVIFSVCPKGASANNLIEEISRGTSWKLFRNPNPNPSIEMQTCLHQCQRGCVLVTYLCPQQSCLLLADRMQSISTEGAVTGCWVILKWQWRPTGSAQTIAHCLLGNWSVKMVGLDNVLADCCGWESGGGKQTCTLWWSCVKVVSLTFK